MELNVHGKNFDVSDQIRSYVEKKIGKLDHYLPDLREANVEISQESTRRMQDRNVVQVTLHANGTILRAEERSQQIYACIDTVADKIHRQIARYKGKREDRWHGDHKHKKYLPPVIDQEALEALTTEREREVIRTKHFLVSPMNQEEAIEQMELLGHNFFIFYNADWGRINVVYRRSDDNYGLLDPRVA